jgi:hypothetical protein
VLAIVANVKGTSAQVIDNAQDFAESGRGQKLFFNDKGNKCPFIGERLSQYRATEGIMDFGQPMSQQEKEQNILMIIQVPLKQKTPQPVQMYNAFSFGPTPATSMPQYSAQNSFSFGSSALPNVENAILKVGQSEGHFRELSGHNIERDHNYPVRVTLQYYKATSNGVVNHSIIQTISEQLKEARKYGTNFGSLVTGVTNRPTEPVIAPSYLPFTSSVIHYNVRCDCCGVNPIRGIRYKCVNCGDYDLCETCDAKTGIHNASHVFLKIRHPLNSVYTVPLLPLVYQNPN